MANLRILFAELGFGEVTTYIQSGNIVFKDEVKEVFSIEKIVKQAISKKFSLNVEVVVKTLEELLKIIDVTPFKESPTEKGKVFITIFSKKPTEDLIKRLKKVNGEGDEIVVKDMTAYILCKKGYSETVYSNNFLERTLKVKATTRNFQTIKKLADIGASSIRF